MLRIIRNVSVGKPRRLIRPIVGTLVAGICNLFPYGLAAVVVSIIYDYYAGTGSLDWPRIWLLCAAMLAALVLLFFGEIIAFRACYRRAYEASADGRAELAEHMRKLPLGFLTNKDPSELGNTMMSDFTHLESAISHILGQLVGGAITPFIALIGMSFVDWRMAVAMFMALPVSLLLLWATSGFERRLSKDLQRARTVMASRFGEYLDGMRVIKSHHLQGANFAQLERAFHDAMRQSVRAEGLAGPFYLVAVALIKSGLTWMTIVGVFLILGGELSVPMFVLFLLVGTRIFDPISGALMRWAEFKFIALCGERIMSIMDEPAQTDSEGAPDNHDIRFEDVRFAYGDKYVLNGLSFELKPGSLTAIVGPSGSGKSTILKLIARFFDPQAGTVRFGGVDERQIDPEELLKRVSVVFQDVYLFQDTIANNIRYGRSDATQAEIEAAAQAACCHDFIISLPDGYQTMVGEGGSTLSGGEKQRISIARALLKDAPVILLDEATASLDPENEADVQAAISTLVEGRTVVMVAHRLKTVVDASQILVLDDGRIVEHGRHDELLAQAGLYARLWELQQKTSGWQIAV
jgi:ATP-binding cassette subfamily B protein